MAKVIGFNPKLMKQCTCRKCAAIIEYSLTEVVELKEFDYTGGYDLVKTLLCPNCGNSIKLYK